MFLIHHHVQGWLLELHAAREYGKAGGQIRRCTYTGEADIHIGITLA